MAIVYGKLRNQDHTDLCFHLTVAFSVQCESANNSHPLYECVKQKEKTKQKGLNIVLLYECERLFVRDDTLVSGRSFLRGYLSMAFSMHDHAGCKLASDWLLTPSLARKFEPFFHLQLTLGRGNTSRTNFIYFYFSSSCTLGCCF